MKTAFLFSGQGSQYPAMGKELLEIIPEKGEEILSAAEKILGYDIWKIIQEGTAEELARTRVSQPAIFTVSLLALAAAESRGLTFEGVAGHSLGEYAAMVAAGVLTMEEGYTAIGYRAEAMEKAAKANPGAMAAVIGLPAEKVVEICYKVKYEGKYVTAANLNSPVQTVIAGTMDGIMEAGRLLNAEGAKRIVTLAVSAAFHSEMMKDAASEFKAAVSDIEFKEPKVKYYSNVLGRELTDFDDMPDLMAKHICSAVRFTDELHAMQKDGFDTFVELGPGRVLTGLVGKTLTGVKAMNIENAATLEAAVQQMGEGEGE